MNSIIFIIGSVFYLLYTGWKIKVNMHMLQLNSYRNERYRKWLDRNKSKLFSIKDVLPIISMIFLLLNKVLIGLIVFAALYLILFLIKKNTKEKKKFAVTMRVKRLIATTSILYIIIFLVIGLTGGLNSNIGTSIIIALLVILNIVPYAVVMLCNTINLPIEGRINKFYYNDAKKIVSSMKDLKIVGITGSYGKTSTKHVVNKILSKKFNVLMTPESYNTPMGVIITIRNFLKPIHEVFIVEMGAKNIGDIKEICDLVSPDMGILTSVGPQHLESFKTIENVKKTKFELIEAVPKNGFGFLNLDDENIKTLPKPKCNAVYYGIESEGLGYWADNIKFSSKGSTFTVHKYDGTSAAFETKLLGKHNIYNILSGTAVGSELGMTLQEIAYAVSDLKPVEHRLELKKNGPITIIDDAFNSNPVGSKMALEVLKIMECPKRILVTPGMIELGDKEYELNKKFGTYAAESCDYIILVGNKQTKPIQDGLNESGFAKDKYYVAANLDEALAHLREIAVPGSVVLLENDLPDDYNE
ncbi:MAG: UDP-N-acetylmuramoyl-tripeptide--D-alanyl-D-alanine ligase [Bacillota bacterium]|nr:UDP-N-acetylmuramoyl-tripeptide--D-alanyl-D-alanine ligase [Bacillota bacterium]